MKSLDGEDKELKKMTVRFYEEDLDYLRLAYPHSGYNQVVRALVARHVRKLRNATAERLSEKLTMEELQSV